MTTISPVIGKNTTISIKSGNTDYIADACVREISEISPTTDTIDTTCYGSSNVRKKIKSLVDLGSITVGINYNGMTMANSLYTALITAESCDIEIVMTYGSTPTVETLKFSALVTGVSLSIPKDDVVTQQITLTLDGRVEPAFT